MSGHAWRKVGSLIYLVQCGPPVGKSPIGRPRLRWVVGSGDERCEANCTGCRMASVSDEQREIV